MTLETSRTENIEYISEMVDRLNDEDLNNLAAYLRLIETRDQFSENKESSKARTSSGEKLYRRSVDDCLALMSLLFDVVQCVDDKEMFMSMLNREGVDSNALHNFMALSLKLDHALMKLFELMHFAEVKRPKLNFRNGYTINCGDSVFTRSYFGQKPKHSSGPSVGKQEH